MRDTTIHSVHTKESRHSVCVSPYSPGAYQVGFCYLFRDEESMGQGGEGTGTGPVSMESEMLRPKDTTLSRVFLKTLELSIGPRWGQPKDIELEGTFQVWGLPLLLC